MTNPENAVTLLRVMERLMCGEVGGNEVQIPKDKLRCVCENRIPSSDCIQCSKCMFYSHAKCVASYIRNGELICPICRLNTTHKDIFTKFREDLEYIRSGKDRLKIMSECINSLSTESSNLRVLVETNRNPSTTLRSIREFSAKLLSVITQLEEKGALS